MARQRILISSITSRLAILSHVITCRNMIGVLPVIVLFCLTYLSVTMESNNIVVGAFIPSSMVAQRQTSRYCESVSFKRLVHRSSVKDETEVVVTPMNEPSGLQLIPVIPTPQTSNLAIPTDVSAASGLVQITSIEEEKLFQLSPKKEPELGLWAARGLLLLVAAIWGTNFAVRILS
jgi:hypothetical protein